MTTELAVTGTHEVQWPNEKVELIKRMYCAGATDDEMELFFYTCKRTGLDPLAKQIHMVKRWNSAVKREVATIQTGIDGYRLIADRTGNLAGIGDVVYGPDDAAGNPKFASVTVTKFVHGERCNFTATAWFAEYVQVTKDGHPTHLWKKMPRLMIGKCAESLALRKAFPADMSGLYTDEEMSQAAAAEEPAPAAKGKATPAEAKRNGTITAEQQKRFWTMASAGGKTKDEVKIYLMDVVKVEHSKDIPVSMYEAACAWAETRREAGLLTIDHARQIDAQLRPSGKDDDDLLEWLEKTYGTQVLTEISADNFDEIMEWVKGGSN